MHSFITTERIVKNILINKNQSMLMQLRFQIPIGKTIALKQINRIL